MTDETMNGGQDIPRIQKIIAVFWPSFLTAGMATIVFFTAFDPLHLFSEYDFSRLGMYSIGFFLFWVITGISSGLSLYFSCPCETVGAKQG